uniref:Uncharacterized protein n=1 Tax=Faxonius propinquus nudivirus TaxID=3139431 RepID=A0AAU8GF14_9VIRU
MPFKSIIDDIDNVTILNNIIENALNHQNIFERKTPMWEFDLWKPNDLNDFMIILNDIDRLYYIKYDNEDIAEYELLIRMKYKNTYVFVEMIAGCDISFDVCGYGLLYICLEPSIFFSTNKIEYNKDLVFLSLLEDGYDITKNDLIKHKKEWDF